MSELEISQVSWNVDGEQWIGVFYPQYLSLLKTHVNGLRVLATRRLDEHAAGGDLKALDQRLAHVLYTRRHVGNLWDASELEMLIPVANRLAAFQGALPDEGGIVVLNGWDDRYLWGTIALEICQAIMGLLLAWNRDERVDGMPCPDREVMDMWYAQHNWLKAQIVEPLSPVKIDRDNLPG